LQPWHDLPGPAFRLLSKEVAYLKLSALDSASTNEYLTQAVGTKGWIIDIRNYPRQFAVFDLGDHFVEKPTSFARFTQGCLSDPGTFRFQGETALQPKPPYYGGKVVVLVDETSMSQAEYTAMALHATPHGLVVGSTTLIAYRVFSRSVARAKNRCRACSSGA
jgi:C-terminal processing protease CtpA/Prc